MKINYLILVAEKNKQKTDCNIKISEKEKLDKCIMILWSWQIHSEFYNKTAKNFAARSAQANLISKADFNTKLISLNKKLTPIKQNIYLLKMN